jgi:RNA polymerase sigma-70 factor (ECF subfamily)
MIKANVLASAAEPDLAREQTLVQRAQDHPEAFAALYDAYVDRVYRYAFRRLGAHADAEDLTAQTFQRAIEALPRYQPRGLPFGAWLFRIAHNLIVDRRRSKNGAVSLDGSDQDEPAGKEIATPEEAFELREELDGVWAAVAGLPALQRRAVVLRFGRDLSYTEIGPIIGRSEAATKQLIYRAMQTLRRRLGAGGESC